MTKQELVAKLRDLEKPYTLNLSNKISWSAFQVVVDKLESVIFPCNWENGSCASIRSGWHQAEKACCAGCAHSYGYLDTIREGTAMEYAKFWTPKNGFWSKSKGCKLPRNMRSLTCLGYFCNTGEKYVAGQKTTSTKIYELIQITIKGANEENNQFVSN